MVHFGLIGCNAAALGVIKFTRTPVYAEHRLKRGINERSTQGKKAPDAEHKWREEARDLHEELSRYYRLGVKKSVWECPKLLSKGKHGVITRNHDILLTCVLFSAGGARGTSGVIHRAICLILRFYGRWSGGSGIYTRIFIIIPCILEFQSYSSWVSNWVLLWNVAPSECIQVLEVARKVKPVKYQMVRAPSDAAIRNACNQV